MRRVPCVFGCLHDGALRPEEAIVLRLASPTATCPATARETLTLTRAAPRTAKALDRHRIQPWAA